MAENNNLPQKKDSAEVALQKTTSLLSITNKILANRANRSLVVSDDAWLDKLIAWADENQISENDFPRDKQAILALTELNLFDNHFTELHELPESIGNLTNLTYLNLSDNKLTELPESIGKLINLTELYLWENLITKLPESICNLTNLTYFNLHDNQLTELPESIGNLTNLTELDLSHNQLTELPKSINRLINLDTLTLHGNPLDTPEKITMIHLIIKWAVIVTNAFK